MKSLSIALIFLTGSLLPSPVMCNETFYYTQKGEKVFLTPIQTERERETQRIRYYTDKRQRKIGVAAQQILIACHTASACKEVVSRYPVQKIEKLTPVIYLLTFPKEADLFALSQALYREKETKLAHPNFITTRKRR